VTLLNITDNDINYKSLHINANNIRYLSLGCSWLSNVNSMADSYGGPFRSFHPQDYELISPSSATAIATALREHVA
jgi:hypothetical protein